MIFKRISSRSHYINIRPDDGVDFSIGIDQKASVFLWKTSCHMFMTLKFHHIDRINYYFLGNKDCNDSICSTEIHGTSASKNKLLERDFLCRLTLQVAQTLGHLGLCKKISTSRRLGAWSHDTERISRQKPQEMGSGAEKSVGDFVWKNWLSLINVVVVCRWNWGSG